MKYAIFFNYFLYLQDISEKRVNKTMKKKIKNDLKKLLVKRERREDDELQNVTNLYVTVTSVKEYERLIKSGKQYVLSLE